MYIREAHEIAEELRKWQSKERSYPLFEAIITLVDQTAELEKQIEKWQQREKELLGEREYTERQKHIAARNRLISIAKGCESVKKLPVDQEHDDECQERGWTISQIYEIATGKHNWPEAMPYESITEDSNE